MKSYVLQKGVVIACILSLAAVTATSAQTSKPPTKRTPAETPAQHEAQVHFKTALIALQNNDLVVAEKELEASVNSAPSNAAYWLNLAEVQSKRDEVKDSLTSLEHAKKTGVPVALRERADALEASLAYQAQKANEKVQRSQALSGYLGTWKWEVNGKVEHFVDHYSGTLSLYLTVDGRGMTGNYSSFALFQEDWSTKRRYDVKQHHCDVTLELTSAIRDDDFKVEELVLVAQSKTIDGGPSNPGGLDEGDGCSNRMTSGQATLKDPQSLIVKHTSPTTIEVVGIMFPNHYGATLTKSQE